MSRQILEEFAGTLGYVSEPGQGSTFVVRLPLERENQMSPAQAAMLELSPAGRS